MKTFEIEQKEKILLLKITDPIKPDSKRTWAIVPLSKEEFEQLKKVINEI